MTDKFNSSLLKNKSYDEISVLAEDIRRELIDAVSEKGGHLASNLGVVELTLAIHRVFDLPNDKLIFDVSHQSYVHKILSGRLDGIKKLRELDGASGFQLKSESEYDFFGGGHSGTSVSAALGFAEAEKLNGSGAYAVAVVGDGSFTNGMIYEALNNASAKDLKLVIVLNDNEMSISPNVGSVPNYFGRLRSSVKYHKFKRRLKNGLSKVKVIGRPIAYVSSRIKNLFKRMLVKTNLFENLGFSYIGPVDGHNQKKLEAILNEAKLIGRPVVVHVCTQKGRGYAFAEENPERYHSVSSFDKSQGVTLNTSVSTFSDEFGRCICDLASTDENVVAITAAMTDGTGLGKFKEKFPQRHFDVGIAEEHAVTFAAGLAASGKKPFVAIYSSFLQRSYDQIIHDVAIQKLPVVFMIDRAGFVSGDGITHQGIFDLAFLLQMPDLTVYTPQNYSDLEKAVKSAYASQLPTAVRYQKGSEESLEGVCFTELDGMRYADFGQFNKVTVITYGRTVYNACKAALYKGASVRVVSITKATGIDLEMLYGLCKDSERVVFVEEQVKKGGLSERIISDLALLGYKLPQVCIRAVEGKMPPHASICDLHKLYGMDPISLSELY